MEGPQEAPKSPYLAPAAGIATTAILFGALKVLRLNNWASAAISLTAGGTTAFLAGRVVHTAGDLILLIKKRLEPPKQLSVDFVRSRFGVGSSAEETFDLAKGSGGLETIVAELKTQLRELRLELVKQPGDWLSKDLEPKVDILMKGAWTVSHAIYLGVYAEAEKVVGADALPKAMYKEMGYQLGRQEGKYAFAWYEPFDCYNNLRNLTTARRLEAREFRLDDGTEECKYEFTPHSAKGEKVFYQEGSKANEWRTLHNEICALWAPIAPFATTSNRRTPDPRYAKYMKPDESAEAWNK